MKTQTSIRTIAFAILALVVFASGPNSANAQFTPAFAQVTSVSGSASFKDPATGQIEPIKVGTSIPAGASIITGDGSSVDLFLGRNVGVVRLTERSTLRIDKLQASRVGREVITDTVLVLEKGDLFANVNKISKASSYRIVLPDGEMNVQQSRFQVSYKGVDNLARSGDQVATADLGSSIKLISGNVSFTESGESHQLNGPSQYTPSQDSVTPLPKQEVASIKKSFGRLAQSSQSESTTAPNGNNSPTESVPDFEQIYKTIRGTTINPSEVTPAESSLSPTTS